MRMTKPLKVLEKFVSEHNLQSESTTEQLKDYPSGFKPNYTVKVLKENNIMFIISLNAKQYYVDEVTEEGKTLLMRLEKELRNIGMTRVK